MTITNALSRQPTKLDYASPTQFKFNIIKLPKVEYFCTAVNIPSIALNFVTQVTPLKDIPYPGEKLTYGELLVTFMVDENLENYREIHGWLVGLGFPGDYNQFNLLQSSGSDRFPTSQPTSSLGKIPNKVASQGSTVSDATLMILTNKNNPILEVRFEDVFPVSVGQLQYNQQATDTQYLSVEVTFKYKVYNFALPNASKSIVTTT